ncbi:hypothetical protein G9A89_015238 [Geosiphon pyriformis]|nr:hypothetical protein G9A89_015238 [Geosiphon pyriformis]
MPNLSSDILIEIFQHSIQNHTITKASLPISMKNRMRNIPNKVVDIAKYSAIKKHLCTSAGNMKEEPATSPAKTSALVFPGIPE